MTRKSKRHFTHYLAMWGSMSTGIVYTGIGVVAILSFLKIKHGGADEGSLLVFLYQFFAGKIVVWLILTGMVSFICWRGYETIKDPYGYGRDARGVLKRNLIALSALADALIAYSAIRTIFGISGSLETGEPEAERTLAARVLQSSWGQELLVMCGIILLFTALAQMGYMIGRNYQERIDIHRMKKWKQNSIHVLAWAGHSARGIILGIIGFFVLKAGISGNARQIVNTDKAFDFIGDNIGHVCFIAVAIATICYGLFMFVMGWYYDSDK